jgi:hypothetical protein
MLHRFWFPVAGHLGIGVTASNRGEATALATTVAETMSWVFDPAEVVEDVDVRDLDQGHVIPNMGVVSWRGVWYPNLG